jgi:hypothetical protein
MDWQKRAEERWAFWNSDDGKPTRESIHRLLVKQDADFGSKNLAEIKELAFGTEYPSDMVLDKLNETVPQMPLLESLSTSVANALPFAQVNQIPLARIKSLTMSICPDGTTLHLASEYLEQLTIFMQEEPTVKQALMDWSGLPNLRKLEIRHWRSFAPACMARISGLKSLTLADDSITTLDWMKDATYQLEKLMIGDCPIRDIAGLAGQQALEILWIGHGEIRDASVLKKLPALRKVHVADNPIENTEELYRLQIQELVLNQSDKDVASARYKAEKILDDAVDMLYRQEKSWTKSYSTYPTFQRRYIDLIREQGLNRRLQVKLQNCFEHCFYEIAPTQYRGYHVRLKEAFVQDALEQYDCLTMPEYMKMQLALERSLPLANPQMNAGEVYVAWNDVFYIRAEIKSEARAGLFITVEEKAGLNENPRIQHIQVENTEKIVKKLWNVFVDVPIGHLSVSVSVSRIYKTGHLEDAAVGILLAIRSALRKIAMPVGMIVVAAAQKNGQMNREYDQAATWTSAKNCGFSAFIECGKRFEDDCTFDESHFFFTNWDELLRRMDELALTT